MTEKKSINIIKAKKIKKDQKSKVHKCKSDDKLTAKQVLFCHYYVSEEFFASGVKSYAKAFNYDMEKIKNTKSKEYVQAATEASFLLTKPKIIKYINDLLETTGLNDQFVDNQLAFLIQQHAELSVKLGAIKEYNALRSRIKKKIDLEDTNDTKAITVTFS